MKSSNFIVVTILLLTGLLAGTLMAETRLPTYEDIHEELVVRVEKIKHQVREQFPANSYVELKVVEDRELYFSERTIRIVLSEKPYGGYFWMTTFKLKDIYYRNIDTKVAKLRQLILKEIDLQQGKDGLKKDAIMEAHVQSYGKRSFNDSEFSVGSTGKYLSVWVQLPSIDRDENAATDVCWMRTTVKAATSIENESYNSVSIRSVIWSVRHQESYYNEAKAGVIELGAIEGSLDFLADGELDGNLQIGLLSLDQTKAFDLNQVLSFFYTVGVGVALEFNFGDNSHDQAAYVDYKARIGVSVGDNVVLSAGSAIKTDHKERGYINTDLCLTVTDGKVSISMKGGYLHSGNMNIRNYHLSEGWYFGLFFSVKLD